jgi:hypothetical protein
MLNECSLCGQTETEVEHLNLYVLGSEGIEVCFECRCKLTECARLLRSQYTRVSGRMEKSFIRRRRHEEAAREED